jgi:N-alpha-acetyltransferase 50
MEPLKAGFAQQPITTFFQPRQPSFKTPPPPFRAVRPGQPTQTQPAQPQPSSTPEPPPSTIATLATTAQLLPPPPSLPPQASIVPIEQKHIEQLRRINSLLLPVTYTDSFYTGLLDPKVSGLLSRVITWQDKDDKAGEPQVIGGLVCRIEPADQPTLPNGHGRGSNGAVPGFLGGDEEHALYMQALSLLSPYRSLGLAAMALEHVLATAALLPAAGMEVNIRSAYAHVWTENEDGLRWYDRRGFVNDGSEPVSGYYFKLRPDSAWLVRRKLGGGVAQAVRATGAGILQAAPPEATASLTLPPPTRPTPASSLSFQKKGPEMEWNDLPAEMVNRSLQVPGVGRDGSGAVSPTGGGSGASSRSSSTARRKKDRAYPAAAFGS